MSGEQDYGGFLKFKAVTNRQTYLNILYHLLSFPTGLIYFIFIVTFLSVGIGLVVVWIGIPILIGLLAAVYGLSTFERFMAIKMLGVDIPSRRKQKAAEGLWNKVKALISNPETWKGMLYLLIKFPLGIISFSITVGLIAASVGLAATPILSAFHRTDWGVWSERLYSSPVAVIATCVLGVILAFLTLHILNGAAKLYAKLAKILLGSPPAGET